MPRPEDGQGDGGPALPDFAGDRSSGGPLPDFAGAERQMQTVGVSERERRRTRTLMLSVVIGTIAVVAVIALVLSQTVFRSVLDGGPTIADAPTEAPADRQGGGEEYIPDPDDPELAPPPPLFTQAPTTDCTVQPQHSASPQPSGKIRGGNLQFTIPNGWDVPWGNGNLAYMTDANGIGRNVEGYWYSVVNVGAVSWPDDEDGGYPGTESAAVAIFQCYATSAGVIEFFGEEPDITDYRSEAITVDGESGWIVQATYHFEEDQLQTSNSSVVTAIVVETPDGPSALASDVAADHEDHVQGLEDMIDSLEVV
ncbi:MAG: hypothetical protein Q4G40_02975 [Brachybacterium sp.]|nr:hypothetical protein [Brachybacterium sp.]